MQLKLFIRGFVETDPFFYIIRQKETGMLYAGYKEDQTGKRIKSCNSSTFMTKNGYQTSSRQIKALIKVFNFFTFFISFIVI